MNEIYYKLNYWYFYDSNSSGIGDYNGILEKINYFKKLKINNLIFDSFLENYEEITNNLFIKKHFGSFEDLQKLIKKSKKIGIKISMIFDFKKINEYSKLLKNFEIINSSENQDFLNLTFKKTSSYYIEKVNDKINNFVFDSNEIKKIFFKIMNLYIELGIDKIILKNIDYLSEKMQVNKKKLFIFINNLIKNIENKKKLIFIGQFNFYFFHKNSLEIIRQIKKFSFDEYFLDFWSEFLINKKNNQDLLKKYSHKVMKYLIKKIIKFPKKVIFLFNNDEYAKINSRFFFSNDIKVFFNKLMAAIFILNNHNIYILQGDEIGQENINFEYEDYLYDKKEYLRSKDINLFPNNKKESDFITRSLLSKLNNKAIFAWNSDSSLGFNFKKILYFATPKNYKINNLETNLENRDSLFLWYKNLIDFKNLFSDSLPTYKNSKISSHFLNPKILFIKIKKINKNVIFVINLSKKETRFLFNFSNYVCKINSYNWTGIIDNFKTLKPFQFLVLEKK
ncbi:Oligo-1,6-glucosidase [Mesomycoplasma neurolyticum]|uniref:Oligo-1,6-glucosidase n=2 Tax=Mesomycoplasma neurolyticum TaxID=2120 RepID=A0A449A5G4_9BACT|nr:Oligo-1,6-glucosidase [Mesomycoplasma neurolyticum]